MDSPYQVGTFSDLLQVGTTCSDSAAYRLTADIDAKSTKDSPFQPIMHFDGYFQGAGHAIWNLNLEAPDRRSGLFEKTTSISRIDSLGLINMIIRPALFPAIDRMCQSSATCWLGYQLGLHNSGTGGIAGLNAGVITNCYVSGQILFQGDTTYAPFGGVVGTNYGRIEDCYALTEVVNESDISSVGVSGGNMNDSSGEERCYWVTRNGMQFNAGYTGVLGGKSTLTQDQLMDSSSFRGFGFELDSSWDIVQGKSYPFLRGMTNAPGALNPSVSTIFPHTTITNSRASLRQVGDKVVLFLPSASLVKMLDASGRRIAPEIQFTAGLHQMRIPVGSKIAIVQLLADRDSRTFRLIF